MCTTLLGKILQRDHLCLMKHIWCNQSCILMSSFAVLSHNIGLCCGCWEKRNKQSRSYFLLFPLTSHGLPRSQNKTFASSYVIVCLLPGGVSRQRVSHSGEMERILTPPREWTLSSPGVWRDSRILNTGMHPSLTLKQRPREPEIQVQWGTPSSYKLRKQFSNDTDDFVGGTSNHQEPAPLNPQSRDSQRRGSSSPAP